MYDGSLHVEELINWINTLDKYFDYQEVDEVKKVKFAVTKLRGDPFIQWDGVQLTGEPKGSKNLRPRARWWLS